MLIKHKIEYVEASTLKENSRNARRHTARKQELLTRAVTRFNYLAPLLVDQNNRLIAGHCRLAAARTAGMQVVPVIRLSHLSKNEIRALMIADNRLAELASWDDPILAEEFNTFTIEDVDFDLDIIGFNGAERDAIIHTDEFGDQVDPADAVAPAAPAKIARPGDLFQIGPHRLGCLDALEPSSYEALLGDRAARAAITDAPYNVPIQGHVSGKGKAQHREFAQASGEMSVEAFIAFLEQALRNMMAALADGALIYAFMDGAHLYELFSAARSLGLEQKALITWAKTNAGMGGLYRQQTEHVGVFKSGKASSLNNVKLGRYGRNRTTLWTYPGQNSFGRGRDKALALHPTVKSVAMLADAILDCTERGDIVLDPFAGSASTLIAAHRTGRIGMGMEIDPLYVDAALARLKAVTGLEPVRESDGATWSDLVAAAGTEVAP